MKWSRRGHQAISIVLLRNSARWLELHLYLVNFLFILNQAIKVIKIAIAARPPRIPPIAPPIGIGFDELVLDAMLVGEISDSVTLVGVVTVDVNSGSEAVCVHDCWLAALLSTEDDALLDTDDIGLPGVTGNDAFVVVAGIGVTGNPLVLVG